MSKFFYALFSKDETGIDAVAFMAVLALLTLLGITIYLAVMDKSLFSGNGFAESALMIIGSGAVGKAARDNKFTNHPPQSPDQPSPPSV